MTANPSSYVDRSPRRELGKRRIVIIGGGFGGLACARELAGCDAHVTLIDRNNYHLFQPLLYQVSTAALSPADIATPLRQVLARASNIDVVMAEVCGIDTGERRINLSESGYIPFDQLVIATGSRYNYYGHSDWANIAPAPKSIGDARTIRARLLRSFEEAETAHDPSQREVLMTVVIVGGGATGVEIAGTIAELARLTLRGNFRRIDPAEARIILIEAGPSLLASYPHELRAYAMATLQKLGVEVRLNTKVERIDQEGVHGGPDDFPCGTVIWAAGIEATPSAKWIGGSEDRQGRILVEHNLAVKGFSDIYAIGDVALFMQDGQPLPALAQVAEQQGRHLGSALQSAAPPSPFRYRSKGDTAVIGRHAAVYTYRRVNLKGTAAWLLWSLVHIYLLIGFERRTMVMIQWMWRYFTFERGARLID